MKEEKTIFEKIVEGEIPCHKIYEDDWTLAFLDINPNTKGHSLVITKKPFKNIYELDDENAEALIKTVKKIAIAIKKGLKADGLNILMNNEGVAGQIVFHAHIHLIPRYKEDRGYRGQKYHYKENEIVEILEAIKSEII